MLRKVGSARILREIGRGGMGVVYEGYQEDLERPVAVKALDESYAELDDVAERFRREGRAYARLRHEAIVGVHDLVERNGQLFLITDLVDGPDLGGVLKGGGPLPADCVAIVGARLAEALDYVHFSGLVHRDVKPPNVMLSSDGEVKLMDFGIAKGAHEPDLTASGLVIGSPSYLPPEVLSGDTPGPAADVWALGVTLYELVTGDKPFKAATADTLFATITRARYQKVRAKVPECPRKLARVIEACLARKPAKRPKPGEVARALDSLATRLLRKVHPRSRLVALLTHRGFVSEEVALTWCDPRTLHVTSFIDLGEAPPPSRSPLRWALAAGLMVLIAAAVVLFP